MPIRQFWAGLAIFAVVLTAPIARAGGPDLKVHDFESSGLGPSVELEPVIVTGASFPERDDALIQHLALFRWNGSAYEPVLYQIDERVDRTFNPGSEYEFTQNLYDVTGIEDGHLDGDDELVFLFRSTGPKAPPESPWPAGADGIRHEIRVTDPTGEITEPRYVYLFGGTGLDRVPTGLLTWDLQRSTSIETELYALDFVDRWLLLGFRVLGPCGDGADLIDRFKGRAGLLVNQSESEELWNLTAFYMGGLAGPIRAIRYIRGAASGVNTISYDIVYPDLWQKGVALRVHPLDNVWFYFDWLPGRTDTMFSPSEPAGVPIDGDPDDTSEQVQDWEVVRGDAGGLAIVYDIPPSPFVGQFRRYTRDDVEFDDATLFPGGYPDDDDSAIGNHGVHVDGLNGSEVDAIEVGMRLYPLCGGIGDASAGAGFKNLMDNPPQTEVTVTIGTIEPVRDLTAARSGPDVVVEWNDVLGAQGYRVYVTGDPALPIEQWTLAAERTTSDFVDHGAALTPGTRYYRVAVLDAEGGEIF